MLKFLQADDFLRHMFEHRMCFLGGNYGTGKSSLAVALAHLILSQGLAENCIATMPVCFAIPAEYCPLSNFIALLDEFGVEYDARSFGAKEQNKVRRSIVAYLRKLNAYAIVSSKVSPDISFRPLIVQRAFSLYPALPLDIYTYGLEEGEMVAMGHFMVWDRAWLWRVDRDNPSAKYGNEFVPSESQTDEITKFFARAISAAKEIADLPDANAFWGSALALVSFKKFYKVECISPPDNLLQPKNAPTSKDLPREGSRASDGEQPLLIGTSPEKVGSGKFGFSS